MLKSLSTLILLIVLLVSGCTIEKRLYRKGWYISYAKAGHTKKSVEKVGFDTPDAERSSNQAKQLFLIDTAKLLIPQNKDSLTETTHKTETSVDRINEKPVSETSFFSRNPRISENQSDAPKKEKNRERNEVAKLGISIIAWLIFFSVLIIGFLILFTPVNLSLFGLFCFVSVFMVLFIGILSLDNKKQRAARQRWVLLTGDMLDAYRGKLITDAFEVTMLLLALTGVFLILFSGSLGSLLFFLCLASVLLFYAFVKWFDFRRVRKADFFEIRKSTSRKLKLGDEMDFRKPTDEEISENRWNRFMRALVFEIFLLFVIIVTIWAASIINPVSPLLLGVLGVLLVFFSFIIWFDVILKKQHPEWERVAVQKKEVIDMESEDVAEEDMDKYDPNDSGRLIRTTTFLGFVTIALLIVALMSTGEFLWVMFGIFTLAFIVTLIQLLRARKTETP